MAFGDGSEIAVLFVPSLSKLLLSRGLFAIESLLAYVPVL